MGAGYPYLMDDSVCTDPNVPPPGQYFCVNPIRCGEFNPRIVVDPPMPDGIWVKSDILARGIQPEYPREIPCFDFDQIIAGAYDDATSGPFRVI